MAVCDICGEEPQAIQIGDMETGDQKFVGVGCAARWGLEFAKRVLPPEEIAAELGPMFVGPEREDLHGESAKVRKRPKPKAGPESATAEGEARGAAEVSPAASDK